jgi:four helix bundle protein
MQDFRDIKVWHKAHALILAIYQSTRAFPPDEKFGIISQLRRASVSIAANIVEGCKRRTNAEYARFLNISEGSASEVEYLILLAKDLNYITEVEAVNLSEQIVEVSKMLYSLRNAVETTRTTKP